MSRTRRRHIGLRARVTVAFAAGALCLSVSLAAVTYGLAHHYLLQQRESSARHQAYANARLVKEALGPPTRDVASVLSSLQSPFSSRSIVYRDGGWFSTSAGAGQLALPDQLRSVVLSGHPAEQRYSLAGSPSFAVGIPLPAIGGDYFEVFSFSELSRTLDLLAVILVAAALGTTVAGGAVGRWGSRRLVRPLREVAGIAEEVAAGRMDRRVTADRDPDLQPLVTSFNRMVNALQERIERDARFASDVSHELRSPLTTLAASVDLIDAYRPLLPEDGRRGMDLLSAEVDRFSALVQDLLELARIDAGAPEADVEEVEFAVLVDRAVHSTRPDPPPMQVQPAARGATVRVGKRGMEQVIANLLDNAAHHGGGAVAVEVSLVDGWAQLVVDDAGPGIPEGERRLVFQRFFRGAAAGRRGRAGGTGLGLALVADRVRRYGGTVAVGDRPGGGARLVVRLPTVEDASA